MELVVTVTEAPDLTIVHVNGRLAGDGVRDLNAARGTMRRPVVIDLSNLTSVDGAGLVLLRALAADGMHLLGMSAYIALRLNGLEPDKVQRRKLS